MKLRQHRFSLKIPVWAVASALSVATITGCSAGGNSFLKTGAQDTGDTADSGTFSGTVHGGPNPVANATITLYTTTSVSSPSSSNGYGYGQAGTVLGTATTDSNGQFTISSEASCPAGQQAYIVAAGGNTGTYSANSAALLMASIGPCSVLSSSTNLWIDEPSTIAAAYALSGFMTVSGTTVNISAPANNNATTPSCSGAGSSMTCSSAGLAHAFLNATNLVSAVGSSATGLAYSTLPTNAKAVAPQSTIHALANSVEACINSSGSTSTACTSLFADTTPPAALVSGTATAPTNTLQALLDLAQYPQPAQASAIFGLGSSIGYYSPALASAPTDWTLAINYPGYNSTHSSFTAPWTVTTDISDNVYMADYVSGTQINIYGWSSDGTPLWAAATVNGANAVTCSSYAYRCGLATDAVNGFLYLADEGYLYQLQTSSGAVPQSIHVTGSNAFSEALDKNGNVFVTSSGTPSLMELAVGGSTLDDTTVNSATLALSLRDILIDGSGNIWAGGGTSGNGSNLYYIANSGTLAAPAYETAATTVAVSSGGVGATGTTSVLMDGSGNVWDSTDKGLYEVPATTYSATNVVNSLDGAVVRNDAIDGDGKVILVAAGSGAGYLSFFYPSGPTASSANVQVNPCDVGAATACGNAYALVNVGRGVTVDSTGSVWASFSTGQNVLQVLGIGAPSWSQANYGKFGRPY